MSIAVRDSVADLPPRTWRRWWRELPGYWRIGAWVAVIWVVLNGGLAVRMAVGLFESPRITALRNRGAMVYYFWQDENSAPPPNPNLNEDWQEAGFFGRSCANVTGLSLTDVRNFQAAELDGIVRDFPNLKTLNLSGHPVASSDLTVIRNCQQLRTLVLCDTEVDDGLAETVIPLPKLEMLCLQGTLVSDAIIPELTKIMSLKSAWIMGTDVTQQGLEPKPAFATDHSNSSWRWAATRWSDGRASWTHKQAFTTTLEGPLGSDQSKSVRQNSVTYGNVPVFQIRALADGDYRLTLDIGGYKAEPVVITVIGGESTTTSIEFRMPVTKNEALRTTSAPSERRASAP